MSLLTGCLAPGPGGVARLIPSVPGRNLRAGGQHHITRTVTSNGAIQPLDNVLLLSHLALQPAVMFCLKVTLAFFL